MLILHIAGVITKKERNSAVSLSHTNKASIPAAGGMPLAESG
jgi:hypothetical protein